MIADRQVLPASLRAHFSEQVAWLPRCFQPSDPGRDVGRTAAARPSAACPNPAPVYVCFNNSYKLDTAQPRAHVRDPARRAGFGALAAVRARAAATPACATSPRHSGIDPGRLVFMAKLPHADYLARYRHADLFLDTATYNAHTTASDAIWAGCPVLTTRRRDIRLARRRRASIITSA